MKLRAAAPLLFLPLLATCAKAQSSTATSGLPSLAEIYRTLHQHPELSHHEENTSGLLAKALREAGYAVTEHIGMYPDGSRAYGVVGILKNGAGPTVMLRGDMDALPITEETGLPFASHVVTKIASGQNLDQTTGVMHACGHDIHTTVMIGAARALATLKSQWHGTGDDRRPTVGGDNRWRKSNACGPSL